MAIYHKSRHGDDPKWTVASVIGRSALASLQWLDIKWPRWIKDAGQGSDSTRDAGTFSMGSGENKSVIGGMMGGGGAVHKGGTIKRRNYMGHAVIAVHNWLQGESKMVCLILHSTTRNRGGVKIA